MQFMLIDIRRYWHATFEICVDHDCNMCLIVLPVLNRGVICCAHVQTSRRWRNWYSSADLRQASDTSDYQATMCLHYRPAI